MNCVIELTLTRSNTGEQIPADEDSEYQYDTVTIDDDFIAEGELYMIYLFTKYSYCIYSTLFLNVHHNLSLSIHVYESGYYCEGFEHIPINDWLEY